MKNGPSIPGWAVGVVLAVFAVALIGFGYKYISGEGPRDPSTYPKEAYQVPGYAGAAGQQSNPSTPGGVPGMTPEQAAERGR